MGKFGDKLRRERELRGVTLEEIAEATKIGTRSLKALEEEQFDRLPGGIFNKGFVRAYAKFLGLDEEQAVADFMAAQGEQDDKPDVMARMAIQAEAARRNEAAAAGEKGGSSNKLWVTCAILVLLTAGAAAGLRYYRQMRALKAVANKPPAVTATPQPVQEPAANPPSSTTADANLPSGAPQANAATTDLGTQPLSQATPGATNIPQSNAPMGSGVTKPGPVVTAPDSGQGTPAPKSPAAAANAVLELQIHVSRATWLSIQADGKAAITETLRDSATKTVVAQDRVVLTTGNSVDVTCNGRSLGILGEDNKRSQMRITADCKVN